MYNPVTPQAAVVVNGYMDLQDFGVRNPSAKNVYTGGPASQDEKYSVMMHDLVFRNPKLTKGNRIGDLTCGKPRLNVYSSFSDKPKFDVDMYKPYTKEYPVFVGLSLTTMLYSDAKSRRSSQVAIRVAGSDTIINTGSSVIDVGDVLCWDMPADSEHFTTRKTNHGKRAKCDGNRLTAEILPEEDFVSRYKRLTDADREILTRSRRFGTALTHAMPMQK